MEGLTWAKLEAAIAEMPEEQKNQRVMVSIEDESKFRTIEALDIVPNDIYYNIDDEEDCASLEELREIHGEDFIEENYKLGTPAGFRFLWDGF